jgi:Mn-dependent DtxR family transcriptional regulator
MRMEHFIDEDLQQRLTSEVAETATDPHGREISGAQ